MWVNKEVGDMNHSRGMRTCKKKVMNSLQYANQGPDSCRKWTGTQ